MSHADSEGEWTPSEALALSRELRSIEDELADLPPIPFLQGSRQGDVARAMGLIPESLVECFIDVDDEPLLGRLRDLADIAVDRGLPISFQ